MPTESDPVTELLERRVSLAFRVRQARKEQDEEGEQAAIQEYSKRPSLHELLMEEDKQRKP